MIREHVFSGSTPSDKYFRWRGGEVSRLENLSDVVFALCLTMLSLLAPIHMVNDIIVGRQLDRLQREVPATD